jgi:hypothetical protein
VINFVILRFADQLIGFLVLKRYLLSKVVRVKGSAKQPFQFVGYVFGCLEVLVDTIDRLSHSFPLTSLSNTDPPRAFTHLCGDGRAPFIVYCKHPLTHPSAYRTALSVGFHKLEKRLAPKGCLSCSILNFDSISH